MADKLLWRFGEYGEYDNVIQTEGCSYHVTVFGMKFLFLWQVPGAFGSPNRMRMNRYSSWWDVNAVLLRPSFSSFFLSIRYFHLTIRTFRLRQEDQCSHKFIVWGRNHAFLWRFVSINWHIIKYFRLSCAQIQSARPIPSVRVLFPAVPVFFYFRLL